MDAALINSKGFGGNNATAAILAPHVTLSMLAKKHGKARLTAHANLNEAVREQSAAYDAATSTGKNALIYNFGVGVVEGDQLGLTDQAITIPGLSQPINLNVANPYEDMS